MKTEFFVEEGSIVRKIWGKGDIILFIFAGGAAEFALNKAVDWLYFTGRLPSDPLGRLFSTVSYARKIVFSEREAALKAIDSMAAIHSRVEEERGTAIPDWAYRDVLFMLIDYSIRSHELLEGKMSLSGKEEVFEVFNRVGTRMGLQGLPDTYPEWVRMREEHLHAHLEYSQFTEDLFAQYRKHLGTVRFRILRDAQNLVLPDRVRTLLGYPRFSLLTPMVMPYRLSRKLHLDWLLKELLLPSAYKEEIRALDQE